MGGGGLRKENRDFGLQGASQGWVMDSLGNRNLGCQYQKRMVKVAVMRTSMDCRDQVKDEDPTDLGIIREFFQRTLIFLAHRPSLGGGGEKRGSAIHWMHFCLQ